MLALVALDELARGEGDAELLELCLLCLDDLGKRVQVYLAAVLDVDLGKVRVRVRVRIRVRVGVGGGGRG